MAEDETTEGRQTVIAIPTENAQAVLDFVASLESDEADVSGHMLSRGGIGGIGGPLAAVGRSLTYCWKTGDTNYPDWSCSDTDR
jgi:hypothetical protein